MVSRICVWLCRSFDIFPIEIFRFSTLHSKNQEGWYLVCETRLVRLCLSHLQEHEWALSAADTCLHESTLPKTGTRVFFMCQLFNYTQRQKKVHTFWTIINNFTLPRSEILHKYGRFKVLFVFLRIILHIHHFIPYDFTLKSTSFIFGCFSEQSTMYAFRLSVHDNCVLFTGKRPSRPPGPVPDWLYKML